MQQIHEAAPTPAWDRHGGPGALGPPTLDLPAAGRHCSIALAATLGSTKAARDFTKVALHGWQLDPLTDDAVLVASELATNAIRHGTSCGEPGLEAVLAGLTWWYQASRLICVVTDCSTAPPVLVSADLDAESGH